MSHNTSLSFLLNIEAILKYPGEWYLPDSQLKLSGRLIFDSETKSIVLELFGDKYLDGCPVINYNPARDTRYHSKDYHRGHQSRHEIILGETRSKLSLYDCVWAGTENIGKNIYLIKYKARFVFFNALVKKIDDLKIKAAVFIYPYLASWFDGFGAVNKLSREKSEIHNSSEKENDKVTFSVTDNLIFTLFDRVENTFKDIDVHYELKYQKFIRFEYKNPVLFSELLSNTVEFKKLLEFVHGKPLKYQMIDISVETEKLLLFDKTFSQNAEPLSIILDVGNFSLHDGKDVNVHMQHQRYMLFSAWNLKRKEIIEVIGNWFSNKHLKNVYNLYIDSNNYLQNTGVMISKEMYENKFLNIIQGLEAFYRNVFLKPIAEQDIVKYNDEKKIQFHKNKTEILKRLDTGSPLKEWFNSHFHHRAPKAKNIALETILKELIKVFEELIQALFAKCDVINYFPRYASVVRNRLSHGTNEQGIPAKELNRFYCAAQILLAICIMDSLDITEIEEKINTYDMFMRSINDIKQTRIIFK